MIHSIRFTAIALSMSVLVHASSSADDKDPKAIVVRAIQVHGGEETLAKYKAFVLKSKGKMQIPGLGEVAFSQDISAMRPDKLKESLSLEIGGNTIQVLTVANGDKISIEAAGKDVETPDRVKQAIKDAMELGKVSQLVALVREKGYDLAIIGDAEIEGKASVGVRVSGKGKKDFSLYFGKEKGLLVKIEHRTIDPTGANEVTEERLFFEYSKNNEGIMAPKKVVVKHDGKTFLEAEVISMNYFEKLDDGDFKK